MYVVYIFLLKSIFSIHGPFTSFYIIFLFEMRQAWEIEILVSLIIDELYKSNHICHTMMWKLTLKLASASKKPIWWKNWYPFSLEHKQKYGLMMHDLLFYQFFTKHIIPWCWIWSKYIHFHGNSCLVKILFRKSVVQTTVFVLSLENENLRSAGVGHLEVPSSFCSC